MTIRCIGSAVWTGDRKHGRGTISTQSGAIKDHPYGFADGFEDPPGTNPEELIGAAHASCFSMALSSILGAAGLTPHCMNTTAVVTLESDANGASIPSIHLSLEAKIPGADEATFRELAAKAKATCAVSRLFAADITLDAKLI